MKKLVKENLWKDLWVPIGPRMGNRTLLCLFEELVVVPMQNYTLGGRTLRTLEVKSSPVGWW